MISILLDGSQIYEFNIFTKCIALSQRFVGTVSAKVAFLPCQSKLPIWSARMAP
jgi:hypothetical protein